MILWKIILLIFDPEFYSVLTIFIITIIYDL
jgi:hypothetical protein